MSDSFEAGDKETETDRISKILTIYHSLQPMSE